MNFYLPNFITNFQNVSFFSSSSSYLLHQKGPLGTSGSSEVSSCLLIKLGGFELAYYRSNKFLPGNSVFLDWLHFIRDYYRFLHPPMRIP